MKRFFTFLKTELKLSLRDMNMPIFAVIMPLVIFLILGIIYGTRPTYDGADHTFLERTFGATCAIAICAGGLMGLPQAVSGLRELKILKRFRVTPIRPVFVLGVELSMYIVYCIVSLITLAAASLLWGVRLHGSLLGFLGSWALTMLSTLSVGMLVGGVAKDTKQASVIASIPGISWPVKTALTILPTTAISACSVWAMAGRSWTSSAVRCRPTSPRCTCGCRRSSAGVWVWMC